uniref:GDP-Man:Man(3)GlcNAc(2)-PP-Dol alpha-1,2-mannosyltransferase n=1 Tax=Timema genevievae TaxID=629358 RepID=A0A7R9K2M8_TIMGE|nr:unnamed protein product [Timema genevievae]
MEGTLEKGWTNIKETIKEAAEDVSGKNNIGAKATDQIKKKEQKKIHELKKRRRKKKPHTFKELNQKRITRTDWSKGGKTIGLFHPYCNAGGGGEKVLWCAVRALQFKYPESKLVVYTGDVDTTTSDILRQCRNKLNIDIPGHIEFVYLHRRRWVEADMYPWFTLLGQSLGSVVLGFEALAAFTPDIYIDTMGYAFTLPLFKYFGGCQVASYVHYPTITCDMVSRVQIRVSAHNNRAMIANSATLTAGKLAYYKLFAWLYRLVGCCSDTIMVNSSWTQAHINELWECPGKTYRVYPPCDVNDFKVISMLVDKDKKFGAGKTIKIISLGQFRPEKDHPLQLHALHRLRDILPVELWDNIKLVIIGSCRNEDDQRRVLSLKDLCKELSLEGNVVFRVNITYEELKQELGEGTIGLHTMWNEHFGIGIVELMAAGLIMVAHRSGGPLMDIVQETEGSRNGFLASNKEEYAEAFAAIVKMSPQERQIIRDSARASVDRFSVQAFESGFFKALAPFFGGHVQDILQGEIKR